MSGPVERFNSLLNQSDFVFAVYFRGHWCPFCISYIKAFQSLVPDIESENGKAVIVTAEEEKFLSQTLSKTGFSGQTIVDPNHVLAKELERRGLVKVAISSKGGYPHGMAQPAVLVVKRDGTAVVSWAIEPSLMNLGGAKDRVVVDEVWKDAKAVLKNEKTESKRTYGKTGFMSLLGS